MGTQPDPQQQHAFADRRAYRRGTGLAHAAAAFVFGFALLTGATVYGRQEQPAHQTEPSQQPEVQQAKAPIAVDVNVVNVLASVRDKKGALVSNLGKDDFTLDEDGRPQAITYFARDSDQPLTLGLLVDTSASQRRALGEERDASQAFLDDVLRADTDKAFLIHFDREVELLQDLTSSRDKLQKALNEMDAPQFSQRNQTQYPQGGGPQGGGNPQTGGGRGRGGFAGGGTLLYDAVYLASAEVIQKEQNRKALIVITDGVDRGSKESLESAIEAAQRADTIVYAIYYEGEQPFQRPIGFGGGPFGGPGGGRRGGGGRYPREEHVDGKKILERMTKETGGNLFEVSKKQTVAQIYTSISGELRNQYSLGYTPASDSGYGYHKIHLATKQKELTVQTRDGYYAR